jgi:hypothetical protein
VVPEPVQRFGKIRAIGRQQAAIAGRHSPSTFVAARMEFGQRLRTASITLGSNQFPLS